MTDQERNAIADKLVALIFYLRPAGAGVADTWAILTCATALARAILATTGPEQDATRLMKLAADHVTTLIEETQAKFRRDALALGGDSSGEIVL